MDRIDDLAQAEAKVLRDLQGIVSKVRNLSARDVEDVDSGIIQLRKIRSSIYEDLNQIQHEYLVLQSVKWLLARGFGSSVQWEWNPRQTGNATEPDLRGRLDGRIVVSAEASASESPIGEVDKRMRLTLEKLSRMQGQRFYFVCADTMAARARTKTSKASWPIVVVRI